MGPRQAQLARSSCAAGALVDRTCDRRQLRSVVGISAVVSEVIRLVAGGMVPLEIPGVGVLTEAVTAQ